LEMYKSVCPSCFTNTQSEDTTFYHNPFHIWEYVGWG
jgi:hypothetical protein